MSADSPEKARLHAIVSGLVQGVNFRYYTQRRAEQLRLVGWVRNRSDGTVEAVAEGPRRDLESLVDFLRVGPSSARVTDLKVEWGEAVGEFAGFEIRY